MTFSELIRSEKPVLVDFFAEWCGPCRAMAPHLDAVKKEMGDRVTIFKVDVDRNPMVASAYNVMAVPTLIVFQNGKPVWRKSGMASASEMSKVLSEYAQ